MIWFLVCLLCNMSSMLCANCWTCNRRIYWFCNCNVRSWVQLYIVCIFSIHDTSMKWCNEHKHELFWPQYSKSFVRSEPLWSHNVLLIFFTCKCTYSFPFFKNSPDKVKCVWLKVRGEDGSEWSDPHQQILLSVNLKLGWLFVVSSGCLWCYYIGSLPCWKSVLL